MLAGRVNAKGVVRGFPDRMSLQRGGKVELDYSRKYMLDFSTKILLRIVANIIVFVIILETNRFGNTFHS